MLRQLWRIGEVLEEFGWRTRHRKLAVVTAGLLAIGLSALTGITLSMPVVMRCSPQSDVSRMSIYRPILATLAPEESSLAEPFRSVIAKVYYEWCTLFGQGNRVKVIVQWNSPTMKALMQINPAEIPAASIGFRNLTPETWVEMNRERVD